MPTFPSRSQGGHKQSYGWQQKKTVQRENFKQTNKQDDRNAKKQQILQENKELKQIRKFNEQIIKVVGLVPMQQNLQLQKVFQQLYSQFENSQFLDSPTTVFKADGQLITFFEVLNTDQAMTCDCLVLCGVDAEIDSDCIELLQNIQQTKLLQIPNTGLVLNKAHLLTLLLNNQLAEIQAQIDLKTDILEQMTHFTNTKVFNFTNSHHFQVLNQFFKNITFSERPLWLKSRLLMNILHEKRFQQDEKLIIELFGQAHGDFSTQQNVFLSQYGDQLKLKEFCQIKWNMHTNTIEEHPIELIDQFEVVKMNLNQQSNFIGQEVEDAPQQEFDQVDDSIQDFTVDDQTDLSTVQDLQPIQKDYEFKRTQFKTQEEQLQYPDELDINPESSLQKVLQNYFSLKSLRNSAVPIQKVENSELNSLFHIKQPTQIENSCMNIKSSFNKNSLVKVVFEVAFDKMHVAKMLQNVDEKLPNQQMFDLEKINTLSNQEFFDNIPLLNYSLVSLFENETKFGLCHVRVQPTAEKFVFNSYVPMEITVGFRKILTVGTPYLHVAQYRGKMLRFISNETEFNISFPCPIFINKSNFPPVQIKFLGQEQQIKVSAKLLQFNSQLQILERIVLTGWPHRIHKHQSIIKYMFFNQNDVKFFMNQYLQTRNGLNGRILSPVTTKGYFKAHFDGQLTSGDCVELKLYKLLEGCGNSMGAVYEMNQGINISGYQAFMELFSGLNEMVNEMYERLKTMKIE